MPSEKVQRLIEEFKSEAARKAVEHKDEKEHEEDSEVEQVNEFYTHGQLKSLFERLNLDTEKYTFNYLAEELGFTVREFLNESTGRAIVLYEAKGDLLTRAKRIAAKTGLGVLAVLSMISPTVVGRGVGDKIQFDQANKNYIQDIANATMDKSNIDTYRSNYTEDDSFPLSIETPVERQEDYDFPGLTDEDFEKIQNFAAKYYELYGKYPTESEAFKGSGVSDKYYKDPRWDVITSYKDQYTTATPELSKSGNLFKPELLKVNDSEKSRTSTSSMFEPEYLDAGSEYVPEGEEDESINAGNARITKDLADKYMLKSDAENAYSKAKSSYESKGGARDIGTGIGAVTGLATGAALLSKGKKKKEEKIPLSQGYEAVMDESYTLEQLKEAFEEAGLDTRKYRVEYLAEQLGFELLNERPVLISDPYDNKKIIDDNVPIYPPGLNFKGTIKVDKDNPYLQRYVPNSAAFEKWRNERYYGAPRPEEIHAPGFLPRGAGMYHDKAETYQYIDQDTADNLVAKSPKIRDLRNIK